MKSDGSASKKNHTSIPFLVGCVLVFGIVLIGFNYWHAMQCVQTQDIADIDEYAQNFEKRILEIESQVCLYLRYSLCWVHNLHVYQTGYEKCPSH